MRKCDVVIIGGGASGLFLAGRLDGATTLIIESNERVGKKLLATGNGKCNLTNTDISANGYNNPQVALFALEKFGASDTVEAFGRMGLAVRTSEGRVYPYSECASSVLDVLRKRAADAGAEVLTCCTAYKIEECKDGYNVHCRNASQSSRSEQKIIGGAKSKKVQDGKPDDDDDVIINANVVVLATGSEASFGKESCGLLSPLGHTYADRVPSLVPVKTNRDGIKGLSGIRVKARVTVDGRSEYGEILFKDFGISGIAAFNVSARLARAAAHGNDVKGREIEIDFLPEYTEERAAETMRSFETDAMIALGGFFHKRVAERILDAAGVKADSPLQSATAREKDNAYKLAKAAKHYKLTVEGLGDKSLAQVMSGGLKTEEFDCDMQSKFKRGIYAVGEAVDIDGECGGYNLQWAWSSAAVAADSINKKIKTQKEV